MRWLLILFLFGGITLSSFAENPSQPSFTKLSDALIFIDQALDNEDWRSLNQALYPALEPNEPNRTAWEQLKKERASQRLIKIFRADNFPATGDVYLISASPVVGSKLPGHSRIRFIKADGLWHLNAVYGVR